MLLKKAVQEQQPLVMSPGEQLIDLVYIDDVVDAFIIAAELLQNNQIVGQEDYVVSAQNPVKLKELVDIYSRVMGKYLNIHWGGRPYRPREVMIPWNNGQLLPGWRAKVSLEEGLRKVKCSSY
jgi:nucleoside-diphosphate-sugar epimerase